MNKTDKTISKASEYPESQNVTIEDLVDPAHMVKEAAQQITEEMEKLSEKLQSKLSDSVKPQEHKVPAQMKHTSHRPSIQSQRCTLRQVRRQSGGSGERRGSHENPQLLSKSLSAFIKLGFMTSKQGSLPNESSQVEKAVAPESQEHIMIQDTYAQQVEKSSEKQQLESSQEQSSAERFKTDGEYVYMTKHDLQLLVEQARQFQSLSQSLRAKEDNSLKAHEDSRRLDIEEMYRDGISEQSFKKHNESEVIHHESSFKKQEDPKEIYSLKDYQ